MRDIEIGAFPFIMKQGKPMLVIITNRSGQAWILPKGQREKNISNAQVAIEEAVEEAGVVGNLVDTKCHKDFERKGGHWLRVYPLCISKLLREWPEQHFRKRKLVSVKQALSLVTRKEHVDAIEYFSNPKVLKQLSPS